MKKTIMLWFFAILLPGFLLSAAELELKAADWRLWSPAAYSPEQGTQSNQTFTLVGKAGSAINWNNGFPAESGDWLLSAEVRCRDLVGEVTVGLEAWGEKRWLGAAFAAPLVHSADFTSLEARITLPAGTDTVKVILQIQGAGVAEFKEVSVRKIAGNFLLQDAVSYSGDIVIRVADTATGPVNRRLFGGHYYDIRDQADAYEQMGMTLCREGGPGFFSPGRLKADGKEYDWSSLDTFLAWSRQQRVEVLALIGGAPAWMTPEGLDAAAKWQQFYQLWSDFAVDVVRHANQSAESKVRYWELWNEPDGGHWFGKPWHAGALEYAPLFVQTARKLKALDPDLQIGTGGIADPFRGSIDKWWVPVARYPGAAELIDFVAIHGYYGDPANQIFAEGIDAMRAAMRRELGREVPLWITEFNVHPLEDFSERGYNFSLQALMVAEYLALFAQKEIAASQYFCVGWWESDFAPWEAGSGEARPIFHAYQFWKEFDGERLALDNSAGETLPAVACRNGSETLLYLTARRAGKYHLTFDGVDSAQAKVQMEGFHGDGVTPILFEQRNSDGSLLVEFEWPQGARALVKVRVTAPAVQ